jgi:multisubunit Na+/H+ antiporter MnhF subunit
MPQWIVSTLIIAFLLAIVASLGFALLPLLRGGDTGRRVVAALTWRVGLACALFLLLLLGLATGVIEPHGLALHPASSARHAAEQHKEPAPQTHPDHPNAQDKDH